MGPRKTYRACGYEQITGLGTAKPLAAIPTRAPDGTTCKPNAVLIGCTGASVRFRDDGTAPTATVGMLLPGSAVPFYYDGNLAQLSFIETTASAVVNILYYEDVSAT
jgi:hypothetical protein